MWRVDADELAYKCDLFEMNDKIRKRLLKKQKIELKKKGHVKVFEGVSVVTDQRVLFGSLTQSNPAMVNFESQLLAMIS